MAEPTPGDEQCVARRDFPPQEGERRTMNARVYLSASGESVDPFVKKHPCPGCGKLVWLASHRCTGDWIDQEAFRASGEVICEVCGRQYWKHAQVAKEEVPTLVRACDGRLLKL